MSSALPSGFGGLERRSTRAVVGGAALVVRTLGRPADQGGRPRALAPLSRGRGGGSAHCAGSERLSRDADYM
jgi:hypothetical protein